MSLSLEEFSEALKEWDEMEARLVKLFGFNPANGNHYGVIRLYNQRIGPKTPDESILEIRAKFLEWKDSILAIFAENGVVLSVDQMNALFRVDGMYGTLYFLEKPVDIYGDVDVYRPCISAFIHALSKRKLNK